MKESLEYELKNKIITHFEEIAHLKNEKAIELNQIADKIKFSIKEMVGIPKDQEITQQDLKERFTDFIKNASLEQSIETQEAWLKLREQFDKLEIQAYKEQAEKSYQILSEILEMLH